MKRIRAIIFLIVILSACRPAEDPSFQQNKRDADQDIYTQRRHKMVKEQIEARGVRDNLVLEAMRTVPRHFFVPDYLLDQAYIDSPLPIGEGQTISQPYIVAFMTEALQLKGGEKVLEIGTGSGYQAAVLAEIVKNVFSIEIISSLGKRASETLKKMNYKNIYVEIGDGYRGLPDQAPFDAIMVTAAPKHIPQPLVDQLKTSGRLIIPVGDLYQELILITKQPDGSVRKQSVLPVRFVPMTGEAQEKK
ncbi:MAG TPA: protein-L-isoaspartate(D-aspartate) O-methyltransferase [bacterium]